MLKWTYLLIDLGAILSAVGLGVWQQQAWLTECRRTLVAIATVALPFVAWDISATWRGHWSFNPDFTVGVTLLGLPIEEILFFIAIPLVAIAAWEATPVTSAQSKAYRPALWIVVCISTLLLLTNLTHEYSIIVSLVAGATAALWLAHHQPIRQWFWWMGAMFGLFLVANTVLTILPVVEYSATHYSSIRIGSIPLEDFFYNFALVNLTVLAWLSALKSKEFFHG